MLIPEDNKKDLQEMPQNVLKKLTIIPVETVDDVLKFALVRPLVPIEWDHDAQVSPNVGQTPDDDADSLVTH